MIMIGDGELIQISSDVRVREWLDGSAVYFNRQTLDILKLDAEAHKLLLTLAEPKYFRAQEDDAAVLAQLLDKGFVSYVEDDPARTVPADFEQSVPLTLRAFRIVLTEACDYACSYCFENSSDRKTSMDADLLEETIDNIAAIAKGEAISIHWFGGEPLLKLKLVRHGVARFDEHVRAGALKNVTHHMTTHGGLMTCETAQYLAAHEFQVLVSFDGLRPTHDTHRVDKKGQGTFDRALRAFDLLREANASVGIIITPNEGNLAVLRAETITLADTLRVSEIHINTPQPTQRGWDVNGAELANQLFELSRDCSERGIRLVAPDQKILRALTFNEPQRLDCIDAIGYGAVSVGPSGALGYCIVSWSSPDHSDPRSDWSLDRAAAWKLTDHRTAQCRSCDAENICGGPCALEASMGDLNPERCGFYLTYLERVLAG